MKPEIYLTIPQPCHENWNEMTPTDKGKFCAACSKQVIDFTLMSDKQILQYLSNNKGGLCGRLSEDQLDRALIERKLDKKKSWWLAFTLPFLTLLQRAQAQTSPPINPFTTSIPISERMSGLVSVSSARNVEKIKISGIVTDENNKPIQSASVFIKGTNQGVTTDSVGCFTLSIPVSQDSITISVSTVGYKTVEREVGIAHTEPVLIQITQKEDMLGDVIIIGYSIPKLKGKVGGVAISEKITPKEKFDSICKRIIKTHLFTVHPNPAIKGSEVKLTITKAGTYELQLLDINSFPIKKETLVVESNHQTSSFLLPAMLSSGVYYLRLISGKQSYLEKIVVQ